MTAPEQPEQALAGVGEIGLERGPGNRLELVDDLRLLVELGGSALLSTWDSSTSLECPTSRLGRDLRHTCRGVVDAIIRLGMNAPMDGGRR
jgi:hypothetical protein